MRPGYGLRSADADPVWGARWIWPDDIVWDRQDLKGTDGARVAELQDWLNNGGALMEARRRAAELAATYQLSSRDDVEVTLFEDERGVIKGNPQASYGHMYVAAWLK